MDNKKSQKSENENINDAKTRYSEDTATNESEHVSKLSLAPYWFLVVVRIVLALLPQTGYIQPDEYFQSIEIVTGKNYF